MTSYTDEEFGTYCLRTSGIYGAEETPSSADLEWVVAQNESEIAMLGTIGLPIWNGSELSVPTEYRNPLARRCILAWIPSFGLVDIATATLAMRESERYLTVMAGPTVRTPSNLKANDAGVGRRRYYNPTTGQ